MRIYARKSLIQDVTHEEMFKVTKCGMDFYKDLFGRPYPFAKYDQIFVPEHNAGAMENVGCVTYNEGRLFRGEVPSLYKRQNQSITNLHELAHMWFGNLVTMKWWNDLWLNEAFATYMSVLAMASHPDLEYFHDTCWVTFTRYNFWGINTDQLSSTHSITCTINQTDEADAIFDGISYGKGSSWLKEFHNLIGHEVFKKGIQNYFDKHQWGNTELTDFVGAMQAGYDEVGDKSALGKDFNLSSWCDQWLTSSGVNILEVIDFVPGEGLKEVKIKQSCDLRGKNRLRLHKMDIALYEAESMNEHIISGVMISDTEELNTFEIPAALQSLKIAAILPNANSITYTKVKFDAASVDCFV